MDSSSKDKVVVRKADAISTKLDDELILLSLVRDCYFSTGKVGARIWELIEQPCSVSAIVNTLLNEFDVEPEECSEDVERFLERLVSSELAEWRV
jgi:hypothetical protein